MDEYSDFIRRRNARIRQVLLSVLGLTGVLALAKLLGVPGMSPAVVLAPIWLPVAGMLVMLAVGLISLAVFAVFLLVCGVLAVVFD